MELKYCETVADSGYARDIQELLKLADKEFVPPLSARGSSTQQDLTGTDAISQGAKAYYEAMSAQPVVMALEGDRCYGFMAFKRDYVCQYYQKTPNLYASTCVVHPDARGKGLMRGFYQAMIDLFPECSVYTRTWHTNISHLKVLDKLGFTLLIRLPDHRGPGMDTVYYCRER